MRIVITGGAGFLGRHTTHELRELARERGIALQIVSFDLTTAPHVDQSLIGDVLKPKALRTGLEGADLVIHMASMIDWGTRPWTQLYAVNVLGTLNVIEACRELGIKRLLYTSSMDVLLDGGAHEDVDEGAPYPTTFQDAYCATKAAAERAVLAADGSTLTTCVLRPCGMYGEADPYHLGNVLRAAKKGIPFLIGEKRALFQHVYVGNVAYAHALAAFALLNAERPSIAGKPYFCTDVPAENFFEFLRPFVEAKGYHLPSRRRLPTRLAYGLGTMSELAAQALPRGLGIRPGLTRSSVLALSRSFSVKSQRLANDLAYAPRYTRKQAFDRTMAYYARHEP